MLYQINHDNYHRFDVISVNRLPARSYFIPFESEAAARSSETLTRRYSSKKVNCLNGNWDFAFYPRPAELPEVMDTQNVHFEHILVPGCWQRNGYGDPFYVNTRYQFPFDPPNIPKEEPVGKVFCNSGADGGIKPRWLRPKDEYNWVGVYRRDFEIKEGARWILSFLGVASCVDVYVNGSFVGYSEGSHCTAEFDITPYVKEGSNELLAVVHRWCTGTYLECQDMFRYNGIFRDVLLTSMEEGDIWDVSAQSVFDDGWQVHAQIETTKDMPVTAVLEGNGFIGKTCGVSEEGKLLLSFSIPEGKCWTAETPTLYDLYIHAGDTCVRVRVGLRQVEIRGDVFTLNGRKLKLRGVNHHDTHPLTGYYMTPEDIKRDVLLCREYNIDTIRTSHYPPDPLLLELCDEYGIYIVDEADLETHGAVSQLPIPKFGAITHDKHWEAHYLDRVERLYSRDKNHACVIMWSLGNEAGGYHNTDAMYAWLKERSDLPIHYESVIHSKRVAYDVGSEMYPSVEQVAKVASHSRKEKQLNNRPYFLCEYAHAMGVGPGAIEEYWQLIYENDNLMGGCVWEMVDHAVLHPDGSYTYGGDHGEWEHDGNFCVDGIFYPDRTPSTGAKIVKHAYRPLRVRHLGEDRYEIFNTCAFTDGDAYELRFVFPDRRIKRYAVSVLPLSKRIVRLKDCVPGDDGVEVVTIRRDTGREQGREQLGLKIQTECAEPVDKPLPDSMEMVDGKIRFRKGNHFMTVSEPETILFRAPTDNDVDMFFGSCMNGFVDQRQAPVSVRMENNKLVIVSRIYCKKHVFLCTDTYETALGGILLTSRLKCEKGKGNLPRFGKAFRLEAEFDQVTYLGRTGESYRDMKDHEMVRRTECQVGEMMEPNIRPQESGNRCDCSYVTISNGDVEFTIRAVEQPFELGVKHCSDRELLDMRHREDVITTGTYVTASAFQMGIGTGSCGPATRKEYRFDCNQEYTLKLLIQ